MGHLLTLSKAGRIVASREPLHPPFRNRCRPCGAAPSDHDGPGQPSMSRSSAATAPVSFPVILAGFQIRSDLAGGGNAVSPPLVPVRPSSRDPASLPGRWRPRSQCRPSPSALASQNPSKSLSRQTSVSSRGEARLSRVEGVAVSGGCRHRAGASLSTLTTFPLPTRRTERADFPHWALARDHALAPANLTVCPSGTGGPWSAIGARPGSARISRTSPCASDTTTGAVACAGTRSLSAPTVALLHRVLQSTSLPPSIAPIPTR